MVRREHGTLLPELFDLLEVLGDLGLEKANFLLGIGVAAHLPLQVVVLLLDPLQLLPDVGHVLRAALVENPNDIETRNLRIQSDADPTRLFPSPGWL